MPYVYDNRPTGKEANGMNTQPIDLFTADFVEIKIIGNRVYIHTEDGLMFRAYRVGKIIIQDDRGERKEDDRQGRTGP
jgi:hypothetical protein